MKTDTTGECLTYALIRQYIYATYLGKLKETQIEIQQHASQWHPGSSQKKITGNFNNNIIILNNCYRQNRKTCLQPTHLIIHVSFIGQCNGSAPYNLRFNPTRTGTHPCRVGRFRPQGGNKREKIWIKPFGGNRFLPPQVGKKLKKLQNLLLTIVYGYVLTQLQYMKSQAVKACTLQVEVAGHIVFGQVFQFT